MKNYTRDNKIVSWPLFRILLLVSLVAACFTIPSQASSLFSTTTTYTVTNTNSNGPGSLYDAITQANSNPGADTIDFDIDHCNILPIPFNLTQALPYITEAVTIQGPNNHTGCPFPITTNHSKIVLNGGGTLQYGFRIQASPTTIKNLVVSNFSLNGIYLESNGNIIKGNTIGYYFYTIEYPGNGDSGIKIVSGSHSNTIGGSTSSDRNIISGNGKYGIEINNSWNNTIKGNRIGTNSTGTAAEGNTLCGILLMRSYSNTIGGSNPGEGNLISGNKNSGICINYQESVNNFIRGNYIGTDVNGTAIIGNNNDGISLFGAHITTIGGPQASQGNLISGNGSNGISLLYATGVGDTPDDNVIQGNRVGTDVSGTAPLGNTSAGIKIASGTGNVIGGGNAGEGNLISGNQTGVVVQGNVQSTPGSTTIEGNKIGSDIDGTFAIPNLASGIYLSENNLTTIGGSQGGSGNLISGNGGNGIWIQTGSLGTAVEGNHIGSDASGTGALGNGKTGVYINIADTTKIGGSQSGEGNIIAFNQESGVVLNAGVHLLIRRNAIFENGNLGIDLNEDGVTANDYGDSDGGPNYLQNFPELTQVDITGSSTTYNGFLISEANTNYGIDIFGNISCDESGYGEGRYYYGSTLVTTDPSGYAEFSVSFGAVPPVVRSFTATAVGMSDDTSEFSPCLEVVNEIFLPLVIR